MQKDNYKTRTPLFYKSKAIGRNHAINEFGAILAYQ